MRFERVSVVLMLGIGLAACSRRSDEAKNLSQLAPEVTVLLQQNAAGSRVFLMPPDPTAAQNCFAVADGTRADLNGTPLRLSDFGGSKTNRSGAESCSAPRFDIEGLSPSPGPTNDVLTIADNTATWTMRVRNFTAAHRVQLEARASGNVRSGEWVTLSVVPADPVNLATISFFSAQPSRTKENGEALPEFEYEELRASGGATGQVVEFDGSRIRFLMGAAPAAAARIDGNLGLALPIDTCTGPKGCQADFQQTFRGVAVTVVP